MKIDVSLQSEGENMAQIKKITETCKLNPQTVQQNC